MDLNNIFRSSRGLKVAYTPLNDDNATDVESLRDVDLIPQPESSLSVSPSPELLAEIQQELPSLSEKDVPDAETQNTFSRALAVLQSTLLVLTPAYILWPIRLLTCHDSLRVKTAPTTRKGPTAYLDGLRGVAALIVYIYHSAVYPCFDRLLSGYGATPQDTHFLQLTIVRVLHSGRASVAIFFVISGFVLTNKAIGQIYKGRRDLVLNTLAGTTFRRPFRLFLPIAASTAITALFVNLLRYQYFVPLAEDPKGVPSKIKMKIPPGSGTLLEQYVEWFGTMVGLIDAVRMLDFHDFNMRIPAQYNPALWTIPHEFKGSLFIMLLVLMFAYVRRWVNMVAVTGLTLWLAYYKETDLFLFSAGMLLAELSIILHSKSSPAVSLDGPQRSVNAAKTMAWTAARHISTIVLAILALHLLSYPDKEAAKSPGFVTLSQSAPPLYGDKPGAWTIGIFWRGVGAVLFLAALIYSPPTPRLLRTRLPWHRVERPGSETETHDDAEPLLQKVFTTKFAQYLGRISYSLYLLHVPVSSIVGTKIMNPAILAWHQTVKDSGAKGGELTEEARQEILSSASTAYTISFIWAALINSLILFWLSDVFTRLVDDQTVRFCRWITNRAWVPPDTRETAR